MITENLPAQVSADVAYQNARKNADRQNAKIEHDKALWRAVTAMLKDDTVFYKQFSENESFRRFVAEAVFAQTYG